MAQALGLGKRKGPGWYNTSITQKCQAEGADGNIGDAIAIELKGKTLCVLKGKTLVIVSSQAPFEKIRALQADVLRDFGA